MKMIRNLFFMIFLITTGLSLSAQSTIKSGPTQQQQLISGTDTLQYSLGAYVGQWFLKNGFTLSNKTLFTRGLDDVINGRNTAIPDSILAPVIASYQLSVQNARGKAMEDQLFASLRGKAGIGVLPDGVHYIILKAGVGSRPAPGDSITINAIGMFPDGTVFEDTFKKGQTVSNIPTNLIPGLNEAIQLMPEGSSWRIFIPSVLAYGSTGLPGRIPANMALVFDVALLKVKQNR